MRPEPGIGGRAQPGVGGPSRKSGKTLLGRLADNKGAGFGIAVVVLLSILAVAAPLVAPYDPIKQDYEAVLSSPGFDHPLGTDRLGRDTLSRLLHGARISLGVGILSQAVVLLVGIPVGVVAGFAGRRVDDLVMRGVDVVYAFPDLLLIILLRAVFGGSLFTMVLAVGLASWPTVARLVRGQALSLKEREFVLAAEAIGARPHQVLVRHILPNALGPVIVAVVFLVPKAIFAEAALSYIGIGVTPPAPSWGSMMHEAYGVVFVASEQTLFPAIAVMVVMTAFILIGEGLRNALDPRTRRR